MRTLPDLKDPWSVDSRRRLDILNVLGQSLWWEGPIVQADGSILIHPGEGVLHPVLVFPLGEILACVSPATLGPGDRRIHQSRRLKNEIFKLKTFDQIRIPDHRSVCYGNVGQTVPNLA